MPRLRLHALTALVVLASAPPLPAQTPGVPLLDGVEEVGEGVALPPGWSARSVGDAPRAQVRAVLEEGAPTLVLEADSAAVQAYRVLDPPEESRGARLTWRWRVDRGVEGAELTEPARDDAPVRVFVVFGEPGLLGGGARTLFYSWGGEAPASRAFRSHVSDRIGVVVLRAGDALAGRWLTEERSPARDYRAVFGVEPDAAVTAVGVMIDTDQTGERAAARLAGLRWLTPPGTPPSAPGPPG